MLPPTRLRRSESFLGVHFDFHAGEDCTRIGHGVTEAMVQNIIRKVHPDYIQIDCKGHPGFSSYRTKVGCQAPGFESDTLPMWRKITARYGVALFMHYSGVWDGQAVKRHPSWARVDEKGRRDKDKTSVFGAYVDELMIPQLRELRDVYGVDGVWVDGDCWAAACDYGPRVLEAFRAATGIEQVPRRPEDPHYFEFAEFCREGFRRYLRHYVDALHAHDPQFQICSNWAFSSHMPEAVSAHVDFLSGDYPLMDSFRAARFEARVLMPQGKPWDLMAWGFAARWKERDFAATKTAVQLQQEAAVVVSLGGGFQTYFKQNRHGAIDDWTMDVMGDVAKFCRARQSVSHRAMSVPQIALLNSTTNYYHKSRGLFSPGEGQLTALRGILDAMLDNQCHVDVLSEHHFQTRPMSDYGLIVLPECECLAPAFRSALLAYVRAGGTLLAVGRKTTLGLASELGIVQDETLGTTGWYIAGGGMLAPISSAFAPVKCRPEVVPLGRVYAENNQRGSGEVAASMRKYGCGTMAGIYLAVGEVYRHSRTTALRDFIGQVLARTQPKPMVRVQGSHEVDVTIMRQGKMLAVHLVNSGGPHADEGVYTFDHITPVGPLRLFIRHRGCPLQVRLEPGGREVDFRFARGILTVEVPRVDIHEILTIQ